MPNIPNALAQADWLAVAAWAGVVVNGLVVAVAFIVQRRQALSDRALADLSLRRVLDDAASVAVNANTHLRIVGDWLQTERLLGIMDHIGRLNRELRIVEHYLGRDLPSAHLVSLLIEARNDLDWLGDELRQLNNKYMDDTHLFPEMDHTVLAAEAKARDLDWMIRIGAAGGIQQTWN